MHRSRVDAFRHRAASIMSHSAAGSHVYHLLTLPFPSSLRGALATKQSSSFFAASGLLRGIGPAKPAYWLAMTVEPKTHAAPRRSSAMDCDRCFDARATR